MESFARGPGARAERVFGAVDRAVGGARAWPVAIFAVALLLKLVYVTQSADDLHLRVPLFDARFHDASARDIAAGNLAPRDAFFLPPLYAYFLALVNVFGEHALMAARALQALAGATTVLLAFLVGRRVFRPSAALAGTILLALCGAMTFHETEVSGTGAAVLFAGAGLWLLRPSGMGPVRAALAGASFGFAALAGAHVLLFVPFAAWWLVRGRDGKRARACTAAFLLAFAAALLPVSMHNWIVGRTWLPVSTDAGVSFYIGNHRDATGGFVPVADPVYDVTTRAHVERQTGQDMRAGELASYWFGRAFADVRDQPARAAGRWLAKVARVFNGDEAPRIDRFEAQLETSRALRVLFVRFWFIAPLAVFGLVLAARGDRAQRLLAGWVVLQAAAIATFHVTGHGRAPVVPVMCLLAGHALVALPSRLGSPRAAAAQALALAALVAATAPAIFALDANTAAWRDHVYRARRLAEIGSHAPALREADAAIALDPERVDGYVQRALVHERAGNDFKAIEDYQRVLRIDDAQPGVHYDLAQVLRRVNLRERAVTEYRRAIELDPGMAQAHNNMGITLREMGRLEEAIAAFRRTVELAPKYRRAYNNLGASYAEANRVDEAIATFEETVRRFPDYPNGYKNLAMAYASQRRTRPALEAMRRYAALNPSDPDAAEMVRKLEIAVRADTTEAAR